jgi:hypothetical protein
MVDGYITEVRADSEKMQRSELSLKEFLYERIIFLELCERLPQFLHRQVLFGNKEFSVEKLERANLYEVVLQKCRLYS